MGTSLALNGSGGFVGCNTEAKTDPTSFSGMFEMFYTYYSYITHCTVLYCTVLYYTILYYTILYYTILYYTILYYTILYYTILYYTILYHTRILGVLEAPTGSWRGLQAWPGINLARSWVGSAGAAQAVVT